MIRSELFGHKFGTCGFTWVVGSSDRESDGELLAAAGSDPDAFGRFYDRYERSVVGYFMRRTGVPEVAADLTAEVFADALQAAGRYRPQGATAAVWLSRSRITSWSRVAGEGRLTRGRVGGSESRRSSYRTAACPADGRRGRTLGRRDA